MDIWLAAKTHCLTLVMRYLSNDSTLLQKCDSYGNTPLYYSCFSGDEEITRYLLEKGATYDDRVILNALNQKTRNVLKSFPELHVKSETSVSQEEQLQKHLRKCNTVPRRGDALDEFISNLYSSHVVKSVLESENQLETYGKEYFCDVFFYFPSDSQLFGCHLFVLFTFWNHFREHFFTHYVKKMNEKRIIVIDNISSKLFSHVLKYIYTGELHLMLLLNETNFQEIVEQLTTLGLESELANEIKYCIKHCQVDIPFQTKQSTPTRFLNSIGKDEWFEYCSDMTLSIEDQTMSCHKIVVCTTCSYFSTMFTSRFEESNQFQTVSKVNFVLHELPSANSLIQYLQYLYGNEFTTTSLLESYVVGSYLSDSHYTCHIVNQVRNHLTLDNVFSILQFATEQFQLENDLVLVCINFLNEKTKQDDSNFVKIKNQLLQSNELSVAKQVEKELIMYVFSTKFYNNANNQLFEDQFLQMKETCPFCKESIDWMYSMEPHYFVECEYFTKYRIKMVQQMQHNATSSKKECLELKMDTYLPFPLKQLDSLWRWIGNETDYKAWIKRLTIQERIRFYVVYKGFIPRPLKQFEKYCFDAFYERLYTDWKAILREWKLEMDKERFTKSEVLDSTLEQ